MPKIINCKSKEEEIKDIEFNVYKFNSRPKPKDIRQIVIICCFSEFGCETLGCMYCIPTMLQDSPGKYKIVVGWYGREYLYRHLVDEFWEMKSHNMWLKEYSRAFHHTSKNLLKIEKFLKKFGKVFPSHYLGRFAVCSRCYNCKSFFIEKQCKCKSEDFQPSLFSNVDYWKSKAKKIPIPSLEKKAKQYVRKSTVGIFARGRKCYGRNLQPEFYEKLIFMLRSMGYNPIWLGEKSSVQPCPVNDVIDFSRKEESRDLELTLSIIKKCEFTIQFWTASTRLSGMMGTPYILFESPDQIWGEKGQEGIRRNLCDFGPSKLAVNHFLNVYNNNERGLGIVKKCILELVNGDYSDIIGDVESEFVVSQMKNNKLTGGNHV